MSFLSRLFRSRHSVREAVAFDERQVIRTMADGQTESVRWDELQEIAIVTTDQGPFVDDVFWVLKGKTGGCVVPSEADGMTALLPRLQQLPGFDDEAVIAAMGSTNNATFVCWRCSVNH